MSSGVCVCIFRDVNSHRKLCKLTVKPNSEKEIGTSTQIRLCVCVWGGGVTQLNTRYPCMKVKTRVVKDTRYPCMKVKTRVVKGCIWEEWGCYALGGGGLGGKITKIRSLLLTVTLILSLALCMYFLGNQGLCLYLHK